MTLSLCTGCHTATGRLWIEAGLTAGGWIAGWAALLADLLDGLAADPVAALLADLADDTLAA